METYAFEFTLQELEVVGKGLHEMPYKDAAPLIAKMQMKIMQQSSATAEKERAEKEKKEEKEDKASAKKQAHNSPSKQDTPPATASDP